MNTVPAQSGEGCTSICWLSRVLSIVVSGTFLIIPFLAITNEDKLQGAALPVLALLVLTPLEISA